MNVKSSIYIYIYIYINSTVLTKLSSYNICVNTVLYTPNFALEAIGSFFPSYAKYLFISVAHVPLVLSWLGVLMFVWA